MKSIILHLIFIQIFTLITPVFANENIVSADQKFIVTAYYSPLPDQSFYLKGSYEADIRLNGNGTHGASGKEVYPGMLAGPKTYAFGTQVYLEGLGIGTIDDRGGAIVSSGSRGYNADRIDIWMGEWEEGLKRAISWGKRTILGKIIDTKMDSSIDLSEVKIEKIDTKKYLNLQVWKNAQSQKMNIFQNHIGTTSDPQIIKKLQTILSELSYYRWEIDGKYSRSLIDAIYDFQIENQLIKSVQDSGAGYYGLKTRAKLQEIYALYIENENKRIAEETRMAQIQAEKEKKSAWHIKEVTIFVENLGNPKIHEVGVHVRKLQQSLKSLGYFQEKDTAIFGEITQSALISYQEAKGIPSTEFGKLGKITKEILIKDILVLQEVNENHTDI